MAISVDDILKLVNAGYTKEEIGAMTVPEVSQKEEPKQEPIKVEEPKEVIKEEPKAAEPTPDASVTITNEQLQQLIQGVAVQTAGGTIEMPKTVDETLADHFKSILKGE